MWERAKGMDGEIHPQELNRVIISLCVRRCHLSPSAWGGGGRVSSESFVSLGEGHWDPWGVRGRAGSKMTARSEASQVSVVQRRPMRWPPEYNTVYWQQLPAAITELPESTLISEGCQHSHYNPQLSELSVYLSHIKSQPWNMALCGQSQFIFTPGLILSLCFICISNVYSSRATPIKGILTAVS